MLLVAITAGIQFMYLLVRSPAYRNEVRLQKEQGTVIISGDNVMHDSGILNAPVILSPQVKTTRFRDDIRAQLLPAGCIILHGIFVTLTSLPGRNPATTVRTSFIYHGVPPFWV